MAASSKEFQAYMKKRERLIQALLAKKGQIPPVGRKGCYADNGWGCVKGN